jgi:hypothetical protein
MTTYVIAQEILGGRWLHRELPVSDLEITWTLSGPSVVGGVFSPEIRELADLGLEPWGTWVHVEDAGRIQASGILQPTSIEGPALRVEAVGVSAYPMGMPYLDQYERIGVDPWQVVTDIWAHLQSYPDGNLGVVIDPGTTGTTLGTPEEDVSFETGAGKQVDFTAGPYKLSWWDNIDCGREINKLASEIPFDFAERPRWNADKTAVEQHLVLGHPRHGRRRFDLGFRQGENITEAVTLIEPEDVYASAVHVTGAGEGSATVRGYAGRRVGNRVRRAVVVEDREITRTARANARAESERQRRSGELIEFAEVEVLAHHENAPLGSYVAGDDIRVQANVDYLGEVAIWSRVETITYSPRRERCRLSLRNANHYRYGG